MEHARIVEVSIGRPDLRIPFPRDFTARLKGQTIASLDRRAKYLLAALSSHETLLMHLGMSGSFRVDAAGRDERRPHDHVVFHMSSGAVVRFNDPRRFGFMDLVPDAALASHPALSALGPEPLSAEFDGGTLARACARKKTPIKVALLDQRLVAGLGNIYASEALHRARLSPLRRASTVATATGLPRRTAVELSAAIKVVLNEAIDRVSARAYRASRFRVYDREGERCVRRDCGGTILRRTQAGRSTFYCPRCQR